MPPASALPLERFSQLPPNELEPPHVTALEHPLVLAKGSSAAADAPRQQPIPDELVGHPHRFIFEPANQPLLIVTLLQRPNELRLAASSGVEPGHSFCPVQLEIAVDPRDE